MKIHSMTCCQIIVGLALLAAGCHPLSGQQAAPAAAGLAPPYAATAVPAPVILPAPPQFEASPVFVQPAPPAVPLFPAPAAGALPAAPVMTAPAEPVGPLGHVAPGGAISPQFGLPPGPEMMAGPGNPMVVPAVDEQLAWDQIADVVSDFFTIAREQRARRDLMAEGWIETAPQVGATWLEPHRRDSVGNFNRWESTFQTIRRRAVVRVVPDAAGYLVEVIVEKELEDLPNPEHATAGAATFRNDASLPSRRLEQVSHTRSSPRWIPLGRDPPLEQQMLLEIHGRLTGLNPAAR